mmetsp:Transcript_31344/g.74493  ORF Transcript_31344/g.74493 Transcript_31344/m.74493 type:complete len:196 (-) Transcript_31344:44-631(-)
MGKKQSQEARKWFRSKITGAANKVLITSGARRASETLQIMTEEETTAPQGGILSRVLGCSSADTVASHASMDLISSLHPAGIAPKCEELFDKIGYASLSKYYAQEGGKAALADYARAVLQDLGRAAEKVAARPGNTVSCFGHAVFLNAVAMLVAEEVWPGPAEALDLLLHLDLGEAEGVLLDRSGGTLTVTHLRP